MSEWIDEVGVDVDEVTVETDKVLLVSIDGQEIWIPKSQVSDNSEVYQKGDSGTMIISLWIAEQKGLV